MTINNINKIINVFQKLSSEKQIICYKKLKTNLQAKLYLKLEPYNQLKILDILTLLEKKSLLSKLPMYKQITMNNDNDFHISIICAIDNNNGIGLNGNLLYRSKKDMNFFKMITTNCIQNKSNAVIMGSNTWFSIPDRFKPLSDRLNIIISNKNKNFIENKWHLNENVLVFGSLDESIEYLKTEILIDKIFVIGGAKLYTEAMNNNYCKYLYITKFDYFTENDTILSDIDNEKYRLIEYTEEEENIKIINENKDKKIKIIFNKYSKI